MESKDQKIKEISVIVCNYYEFDFDKFQNTKNRRTPLPKYRQIVSLLAKNNLSISYRELADFFNKKTHSTIYLTIKSLKERMEFDKTLKKEVNDIESILIENGLSKKSNMKNEWYEFIDLDNCILARKENQSIVFSNFDINEVQNLISGSSFFLPDELKQFSNTNTFIYKPKKNSYE